jgi:aminobenzoyl-glutamate transport protein
MTDRTPAPELAKSKRGGLLDKIEWMGNKLPDPATLFLLGALLVIIISGVAAKYDWKVQKREFRQAYTVVTDDSGEQKKFSRDMVTAESLFYKDNKGQLTPIENISGVYVKLQTDEKGEPVLELVDDQRTIRRILAGNIDENEIPSTKPLLDQDGEEVVLLVGENIPAEELKPISLCTSEKLYWMFRNLEDHFINFAPLGIVLTGMLGIGVAEKSGLLAALMRAFTLIVPKFLLTPTMVFLGIMSSAGIDAGYIVLPPLAAALYLSIGRSPLAGVAAVFAGVAAGFNANLFITGLDPMLAEFTAIGAKIYDSDYSVAATCNWYFAASSTFVMTMTGWAVTSLFVERRLNRKPVDEGGPVPVSDREQEAVQGHSFYSGLGVVLLFLLCVIMAIGPLTVPEWPTFSFGGLCESVTGFSAQYPGIGQYLPDVSTYAGIEAKWELWQRLLIPVGVFVLVLPFVVYALAIRGMGRQDANGLAVAAALLFFVIGGVAILANVEGSPLWGNDYESKDFARWVKAIVPIIFLGFLLPGIGFGIMSGRVKNDKDVAKMMIEAMAGMAPIIILAFFAGQFIELFKASNLGTMLAYWGGQLLVEADLSAYLLIIAFILITYFFNLFVGSMSAKYAMFAPIFVPMLMMTGISPELTQAAYRIGDSCTNIVTPLNAYLVIVLVFMQKYVPKAGMGTLVAMMMPYAIVFVVVWTVMLMGWMYLGWPLGPEGPLWYSHAVM